ncbi:Restriction endonuclease, type I [Desulfonema limicola]|uniref:Restriction endonuclease, type I n=1 Tax=Desulfonema limicola TaxID=45656 RepID=A0A975GG09_9BACT|nr:Restriction endonuclease, type I [Desulfonema limicola]
MDYVQPTNYIIKITNYNDSYKIPVLTPGKTFIKGYTNETKGIFSELPVIIFDDFTTASKYVNFKFKVKSSAMKILVPTSDYVNVKLTYYFMQVLQEINNTHKRYWISIYSKKLIPIAPLPEQRAIVSKIDQLFSELDNGIANLKAAKDKLEIYRQAVLKKAFEGGFIEKSKRSKDNWKKVKVKELGIISTGTTPSKKNKNYYLSRDFPFYKPTDLNAGKNVNTSIDALSEFGIKACRYVPPNSILVTCIGATIGKTGLIKNGGGFNQQINAIAPFEKYNPEFIYYQAISFQFQEQIKNNASATTLPILNKGKFLNLEMIICSKEEQHQIVQEIETRLSVCDNLLTTIEYSLEKSEALRQSILKQAFEGRLLSEKELDTCKQQPDWEPAEELLKRIKNENKQKKSKEKPKA